MSGTDTSDLRLQMDALYAAPGRDAIPWDRDDPPALFADLVRDGVVAPCAGVDLGCGTGTLAAWLAARGFTMTGIDLSPVAIRRAQARALQAGVACTFLSADIRAGMPDLDARFDAAFEWEVLHHVPFDQRIAWVDAVWRMLRPGALYAAACFSESDDSGFAGSGPVRTTRIGTTLYLSTEHGLRELYAPRFEIEDLRSARVPGTAGEHVVLAALLRRADAPRGAGR